MNFTTVPSSMADPVIELNNYLQGQRPNSLAHLLMFTSVQKGPNHDCVHVGTYSFRNVVIGTGQGPSKGDAKHAAATKALQHLRTHGVSE